MRLRLSPGNIARVLRNLGYTPGRDLRLPYPIELDETDYPLGTTLVGASLVIAQDFGSPPLFAKQITGALSASGQITDTGADGSAALYFALAPTDLLQYRTLGPLAYEVVVTDSRGLQATLDEGSLYPLASTAGKPVDHVLIVPATFTIAYPTQQQLVATAYDVDDQVLGDRLITWSTSDPTVAQVDATGLVTIVNAGAVIITATAESHAATSTGTTSVPPALALKLDWDPLKRRADLAQPLVFAPYVDLAFGAGSGYQPNNPTHGGCNTLGTSRVSFPKSATEWGGYARIDALMANSYRPTNFGVLNQLVNQGPFDNTTAWQCYAPTVGGDVLILNDQWHNPDSMDLQEVTTWKRGMAAAIKADPTRPQDIGKQLRIGLSDSAHLAGAVFIKGPSLITLTADWQHFYVEWDSYAQFSGLPDQKFMIQIAQDDTGYIVAPYSSWYWHAHEPTDPSNWARPLPWHETLGWLAEFQNQNSWVASDDPVLFGSATKNATVVAAPDSARHYGGRTMKEFILDAGEGITTAAPQRCEQAFDVYPTNTPTGAVWLHWYLEAGAGALPADGALQGYLVGSQSGHLYGPVPLIRDLSAPLPRFYRCRIRVNAPVVTGDLDFTPRIVNASGGQLRFNAYRAAMTAENPRSFGYHHSLVPKRSVTAPVYSDAAFGGIRAVPNLSVEEGLFILRHLLPYGMTDIVDLNGNASDVDQGNYMSPCLWQSGPLGSADTSFNCDIRRSQTAGAIDIVIQVQRGDPHVTGDWRRWNALITAIPVNAATFPRLVAFDIALAWKVHAIVAFGIGHGTGNGITWLADGGTFLGGTVSITSGNGTAWNLDADGSNTGLAIGGDRDLVRESGGFTQAIKAGTTVDPTTVKSSIEYHLATKMLARQDYR